MIAIDRELLESVGLGSLDETATELMLRHIYSTLESRVGKRLVDVMTPEEVDHFTKLLSTDRAAAESYLTESVPRRSDIVRGVFAELVEELRRLAPRILDHENHPTRSDR